MFSMVVIGGMGSMTGAVIGAVYLRGVQYFLPSEYQLLATGVGLLVLLMVFPGGLGQIVFGVARPIPAMGRRAARHPGAEPRRRPSHRTLVSSKPL